jgi:hypothetical protein
MHKAGVEGMRAYKHGLVTIKHTVFFSVMTCAAYILSPLPTAHGYDEALITQMESKVVSQFCMEREWLKCFHEEPSNCEAVVKRFVRPCLTKTLAGQDAQGDHEGARNLATSILACFNAKFEEDHRFGKDPSPACKNAPAHLQ